MKLPTHKQITTTNFNTLAVNIPELMSPHLSFKRIALAFLSTVGKSGLIEIDVSAELL